MHIIYTIELRVHASDKQAEAIKQTVRTHARAILKRAQQITPATELNPKGAQILIYSHDYFVGHADVALDKPTKKKGA